MKKILCLATCYLLLATFSKEQVITTIAGNGTQGYSGDGSAATNAELYAPAQLAIDATGTLYFADGGNHCIRKINTSGIIITVAGNGTAGFSGDGGQAINAELNAPNGITIDGVGNMYIMDSGNERVRKVNTSGIISTIAGNGTAGYSGDGGQATNAEFNEPDMLAVDANGNIYIADTFNNRIRKVDTSGIITTIAGNGTQGFSGDGGQATNAELAIPTQLVFDTAGNMYIVDDGNNRIRKISTAGIITTIAGNGTAGFSGDGGLAINAEFNHPDGMALGASGNMYIGDSYNYRVRKVDTSGIITTIAGNGTAGFGGDGGLPINAEFDVPGFLAFDALGNIYIADFYNNRIREITGLTGIKEQKMGAFNCEVFPNPNNGNMIVTYSINTGDVATFELFDFTGRAISSYPLSSGATTLNISENALSNGMYFYRIMVNNTIAKTDKLVIIK